MDIYNLSDDYNIENPLVNFTSIMYVHMYIQTYISIDR
jgi:hypothetical protein